MAIRVTLDQLPKALKKATKAAAASMQEAAYRTAEYGVREIKKTIAKTDPSPVATDEYREGWVAKRTKTSASIENRTAQAYYVEHGRKPGPAKLEPFIRWAAAKIARGQVSGLTVSQLAFLARRKVVRFGYKPRPVVKSTMPKIKAYLKREIEKELKKSAANFGKHAGGAGRAQMRIS